MWRKSRPGLKAKDEVCARDHEGRADEPQGRRGLDRQLEEAELVQDYGRDHLPRDDEPEGSRDLKPRREHDG